MEEIDYTYNPDYLRYVIAHDSDLVGMRMRGTALPAGHHTVYSFANGAWRLSVIDEGFGGRCKNADKTVELGMYFGGDMVYVDEWGDAFKKHATLAERDEWLDKLSKLTGYES